MNIQGFEDIRRFWQQRPGLRAVAIAAIAFFTLVLGLSLHTYLNFYASEASFDRGIFNQVFWNGLHGNFFQGSLSSSLSAEVVHNGDLPRVNYHRLGQHFTPALLLWLPIYALSPNAIALTTLQVALVTTAGLVLFALAREHELEPAIAATLTVSFYCATAVIGPTLQNFHDFSQLPLFAFGMLYALEKRWWWLYVPLAILIPMAREDSGVLLFSLGAYLALSRKAPRLGLGLCAYSVIYVLTITNVVMPWFSADVSQRFAIERFGQYVESDSASTLELLLAMLRRPWLLAIELVTPFSRTLSYLLGQWLPLAFISAISPAAWIASGAPLLLLLLAKGQTVLSITTRYALAVVPGLFYGSLLWWSRHPKAFRPRLRKFWSFCLALSLLFTLTPNPHRSFSFLLPDSFEPRVYAGLAPQWQQASEIRQILSLIPPHVSVSATSHLVPHLSSRREILRLPALELQNDAGQVERMEYLLADLWQLEQYRVAFGGERTAFRQIVPLFDRLLDSEEYGAIAVRAGVVLLQRHTPSNPAALENWLAYRSHLQAIFETASSPSSHCLKG
ncbi:DUF2079 domain-containing protein [Synechococcus sp. PCC 7336]|uniref:DUF2079 domain-containing protein n=1 Tax=Synechococcus sp. PCC 7336 TaxID=195250 RepID=UPI0003478F0F|nr:DUF2079 domain-containing protein [Synechococcus sp. PCC 7336]